jgi:hypothetical protein
MVSDLNGVHAGEPPLAVLEVHLAYALEQHMHNNTYTDHRPVVPLATRTTNSWGSWPSMIDANLGGGAIVPIHARVDGDAQFEPGEVNGDGLGR